MSGHWFPPRVLCQVVPAYVRSLSSASHFCFNLRYSSDLLSNMYVRCMCAFLKLKNHCYLPKEGLVDPVTCR